MKEKGDMVEVSWIQLVATIFFPLARGFLVTLQATLCGGIVGMFLGVVLGAIQSKRLNFGLLSRLVSVYVSIIRGTPLIVQAFLIYYVVPDIFNINFTPFVAGCLALSCNSAAYVAETVRAGINALHRGQWEACFVLGYDKKTTVLSIILPQALRNVLPTLTNELTALLKETAILGLIGLEEITKIGTNMNSRLMEPMVIYVTIALFYLTATTVLSSVARYLEVDHS